MLVNTCAHAPSRLTFDMQYWDILMPEPLHKGRNHRSVWLRLLLLLRSSSSRKVVHKTFWHKLHHLNGAVAHFVLESFLEVCPAVFSLHCTCYKRFLTKFMVTLQAGEFATIFDTGVPGTDPVDAEQSDYIIPVTMNVKLRKHDGTAFTPDRARFHASMLFMSVLCVSLWLGSRYQEQCMTVR